MLEFLLLLGFALLIIYGIYRGATDKSNKPDMEAALTRMKAASQHRSPILYLYSFSSSSLQVADIKHAFAGKGVAGTEAHWKDAGHMITNFLTVIAPTEELPSPDDTWRLRPWAPGRPEQVKVGDDWQQDVLRKLPTATLVVIQLDLTEGLLWELQQVVRTVTPTKVLLVLPPTQSEYDTMRKALNPIFPLPLPAELPETRLVTFNPQWQPCILPLAPGGGAGMWQTLELVFLQNGFEMPPWREFYGYGPRQ
jgi:hypothetical protein